MSKYILILFSIVCVSCWGQYPKLRIKNGFIYNANQPKKVLDSVLGQDYINIGVYQTKDGKYHYDIPFQDSTKYYWQKYNLYTRLFNEELERINNLEHKTLTRKLLRLQDSTSKYYELLQKLKK